MKRGNEYRAITFWKCGSLAEANYKKMSENKSSDADMKKSTDSGAEVKKGTGEVAKGGNDGMLMLLKFWRSHDKKEIAEKVRKPPPGDVLKMAEGALGGTMPKSLSTLYTVVDGLPWETPYCIPTLGELMGVWPTAFEQMGVEKHLVPFLIPSADDAPLFCIDTGKGGKMKDDKGVSFDSVEGQIVVVYEKTRNVTAGSLGEFCHSFLSEVQSGRVPDSEVQWGLGDNLDLGNMEELMKEIGDIQFTEEELEALQREMMTSNPLSDMARLGSGK